MSVTLGAILLGIGHSLKPETSTYSMFGHSQSVDIGNQSSYDALVAFGVIILLAGG
jgi:hypothetical protein